MDGILPDARLKEIWWDHSFEGELRFEPTLYPFFLRLMEKLSNIRGAFFLAKEMKLLAQNI